MESAAVARSILHRTFLFIRSNWPRGAGKLAVMAAGALVGLTSCARLTPPEAVTAGTGASAGIAVKRGSFRDTVRLHGTVGAVQSKTILAPRLSGQMGGMMVITKIVSNGSRVREGDLLVEFDSQNQLRNVLDRQAEYDNLVQQIKKKQADQTTAIAADETELKGAEVDLQSARVDMRKNEVIPGIQAEINKQNLAEAEAKLKQLKSTFALKREAAAAELRILEIQRDRAQKAVAYAQGNIEKMSIKSPLRGLVVLSPIYKGTRQVDPQEGDEVRPGGGIMLVVNPSAMQVTARLNQVDVSRVHIGQAAEVRLDAYPDLVLPGKVERISAISTASQYSRRIRYFAAVISIQGSNPKLLPDLTAAVDIKLQTLENVLLLPREAIVMQQGQAMVEVLGNGRPELRPVKLGPRNDCEVVVESGIQDGWTVSLHPQVAAGAGNRLPE
jgi:HlyD family secretion protein